LAEATELALQVAFDRLAAAEVEETAVLLDHFLAAFFARGGDGQGRRYVLQNGQEWEQIDATQYSGGRKDAPKVSMRPGVMG
ncbi:hypothetical protein, partial [Enterobacter hormaechei]|uniref:hypothetical protein n=1 Tax=Enterobacter hormaechei TaxID=158836 RepID=UPI002041ED1C